MKRLANYFDLIKDGVHYEKGELLCYFKILNVNMAYSGDIIFKCFVTEKNKNYEMNYTLEELKNEVRSWDKIY